MLWFVIYSDYSPSPWDNFTNIMADTLGVKTTSIDPSDNFREMGGNSLNVVSAVLKLQESGFTVTVEQFIDAAGSMEKLFMTATACNGATATGHHFTIKPLSAVDATAAQTLVAQSFLAKCELFSQCGGMAVADFLAIYARYWDSFLPYSRVVVDERGALRACAFAMDQYDLDHIPPDDTTHGHFVKVTQMLASVTQGTRKRLNPSDKKGVDLSKVFLKQSIRF